MVSTFNLSIMPLILVWNLSLKSLWMSLLLLCRSATFLSGYLVEISVASSVPVAPPPITKTFSLDFICKNKCVQQQAVADLGDARDVHPSDQNFFHFHAVFRKKKGQIVSWRPPFPRVGAPSGKSWIHH